MRRHWNRSAYYVVGDGIIEGPSDLFASSPEPPWFRFGRMFDERRETINALICLGNSMNAELSKGDSTIPSGYTYLGQFIAHEITFDRTKDLPEDEPIPKNYRSPQIDLDSLYGTEPRDEQSRNLYEDKDSARLKVGTTFALPKLNTSFENDLPRDEESHVALIGDERNDENLAVAQTHVALIKFHNNVVEALREHCPKDKLFECARGEVVRHFQWIIVNDYLKTILDQDVLKDVLDHGVKWFKVKTKEDLFMPLEFSAAAFRMGHSMVRPTYEWNYYHSSEIVGKPEPVNELFGQTNFSGSIGKDPEKPALPSDWVIDWRRFFDFSLFDYAPPKTEPNMARKIDTSISMNLETITGFPHGDLTGEKRSITVRNLLRGFALGLPTGEGVAAWIGEKPLTQEEIAEGREECFNLRFLKGKTPLWFYILREAELRGGSRLGRIGSRIVAETLVGLIQHSSHSILDGSEWRPRYGRGEPGTESARFEMVDLLHFAGVVDPIGKHLNEIYKKE